MHGATISCIKMIKGLKQFGIKPIVIYPDYSDDIDAISVIKSSNIKCIPCPIVASWYRPFSIFSWNLIKLLRNLIRLYGLHRMKKNSFKKIYKIAKEEMPSIIHTNVGVCHEGLAVAEKIKIPHIWHLREYQDLDFGFRPFPSKRNFIKKLRKSNVITITKNIQKHFSLENYPKAKTIYNAILSKNNVIYLPKKRKIFLCASRVSPEKGHYEVIEAFAEFHKKYCDYKLIIAGFGDANYINICKELAEKLNVTNNVEFVGYKNEEELSGLMKNATALIVNSKFEGFGRMTAEALFYGCLVIGKNTGGTKEIIEQVGGGFLYNDVTALGKYMEEMLSFVGTTRYKEIISNAQERIVKTFSIEQNINNIISFYEQVSKNTHAQEAMMFSLGV